MNIVSSPREDHRSGVTFWSIGLKVLFFIGFLVLICVLCRCKKRYKKRQVITNNQPIPYNMNGQQIAVVGGPGMYPYSQPQGYTMGYASAPYPPAAPNLTGQGYPPMGYAQPYPPAALHQSGNYGNIATSPRNTAPPSTTVDRNALYY